MYYTHTSALYMRACRSGPVSVPPVSARGGPHRTGPGSVLVRCGTPTWALKINQMIIKLHWLHFWRLSFLVVNGICASDKFAMANISTRSTCTSAEGRENCRGADFVVAGGIAGCQNDSLRCRGWRQGGIVATLCQIQHQSSVSLAFVRAIHRWPVASPNKGPVTQEMFPFDDVIMSEVGILAASECLGAYRWWARHWLRQNWHYDDSRFQCIGLVPTRCQAII